MSMSFYLSLFLSLSFCWSGHVLTVTSLQDCSLYVNYDIVKSKSTMAECVSDRMSDKVTY